MRIVPILAILSCLIATSCEPNAPIKSNIVKKSSESNPTLGSTGSTLILEAVVLGKNEKKKVKQLLITQDLNDSKVKNNLKKLAKQTPQDIISADQYDLVWLDIKNIKAIDLDLNNMEVGSKIRFTTDNEQLDTLPPTLIAQEIEFID